MVSGVLSDLTITVVYRDPNQQNTFKQIHFSEAILNSFQNCVCNSTSAACVFTYSQGASKTTRYITNVETKLLPSKELETQVVNSYICGKVTSRNQLLCMRQRENKTCPVPGVHPYYFREENCGIECVGLTWSINQSMTIDYNSSTLLKYGQCQSPCSSSSSKGEESTTISLKPVGQSPDLMSSTDTGQREPQQHDEDDEINYTFIFIGVAVVTAVVIVLTVIIVLLWKRYLAELKSRNETPILHSGAAATGQANDMTSNLNYSQTSMYNDVFILGEQFVVASSSDDKIINTASSSEPVYSIVNKDCSSRNKQTLRTGNIPIYDSLRENNSETVTARYRFDQNVLNEASLYQNEHVSTTTGSNPDQTVVSPNNVYSKLGEEVRDCFNMYDVLTSPEAHAAGQSEMSMHATKAALKEYTLAKPISDTKSLQS
ncbi:hypothetical protein Bpfe_020614 [Biomphalaria pfeifferi]|uniref:Uncharacterized protein n=1 Tax=Biomphalaria pfeifferi TaxID=112525 RepID=A0AAD8B944_BIOPF|nr:hypothetical protein Bpfe_020614 [Biomphalaria pfeifferi]